MSNHINHLTLLLLLSLMSFCQEVSITFQPKTVMDLRTDNSQEIMAEFRSNETVLLNIKFSCQDPDICEILNPTHTVQVDESLNTVNFTVRGLFLGHTKLVLKSDQNQLVILNNDPFKITIFRTKKGAVLSQIFTYVMAVIVVVNTFMMGTQLQIEAIKDCVKKPIGPVIGFCSQYIAMPMIAFGWASLFLFRYPALQFGYFCVGCSPGGGASNFWTIILEGNIDLSVTMTFFSNLAAIGMLPFWLYTLGRQFFFGEIEIPFLSVLQALATLIIPAFFGLLLTHFKPHLKKTFEKVLKIFTFCFLLIALPFAVYANFYIFNLFTWYTVVCGFLLPWSGYFISYSAAFILKQPHKDCRTIAIETGIQNATIAILLCQFSLPEPDGDLTLVMPVCVLVFTSLPLWIFLICLKCYNRKQANKVKDHHEMTDKKQQTNQEKESDKQNVSTIS